MRQSKKRHTLRLICHGSIDSRRKKVPEIFFRYFLCHQFLLNQDAYSEEDEDQSDRHDQELGDKFHPFVKTNVNNC